MLKQILLGLILAGLTLFLSPNASFADPCHKNRHYRGGYYQSQGYYHPANNSYRQYQKYQRKVQRRTNQAYNRGYKQGYRDGNRNNGYYQAGYNHPSYHNGYRYDSYNSYNSYRAGQALKYGALGAGAGYLLSDGDRSRDALVGAGLGAALGILSGY